MNQDVSGNRELFVKEMGKASVGNVENCNRIKYRMKRMLSERLRWNSLRICIMWIQKRELQS